MKTHLLVAITFLILFACKKNKKTDEVDFQHTERLKSLRMIHFYNGTINSITTLSYHYDSSGHLSHTSQSDSTFVGTHWLIHSPYTVFSFFYNSFDKVIKAIEDSSNYELNYFYDSNQFLVMSVSKNSNMQIDTTFYTKNGNMIISNSFNAFGRSASFFVTNTDSILSYDTTNTLNFRTKITFSSKPELSFAYINKFFSYTNQNEMVSRSTTKIENGTALTETRQYSNTYDNQGYIQTNTCKINNVVTEITHHTYY